MFRKILNSTVAAAILLAYSPIPAYAVPQWNGQMQQGGNNHENANGINEAAEDEMHNRENDRDALQQAERAADAARAEARRKWVEAQQAAQRAAHNQNPRMQEELDRLAREAHEAAAEAQRAANEAQQYAERLLDEVKSQFDEAKEEAERMKRAAAQTIREHQERARDAFEHGASAAMDLAKAMVLATMLQAMGMGSQARELNVMITEAIAFTGPVGAAVYGAALVEVIDEMKQMLRLAAKAGRHASDEAQARAAEAAERAANNSERGAEALIEMMRELQRQAQDA
ncbi:MAG: hypothetical protein KDD66_04360 [Bdellovibrionales bacterium]|nr:hypothetical protein [Bdellovibrionales bacterium]